jgi:hypothetical protein
LVDNISLAVGFCIYENSLETVKRAIESWKDHVDVIYAIDGKFEEFESDQYSQSLMWSWSIFLTGWNMKKGRST